MILTLYKTGFKPEANGVFENLSTYLESLDAVYSNLDFMYVKPALETSIKISGNPKSMLKSFDYAVLQDGSNVYYYYVDSVKWKAQETAELGLSLDTLNTFFQSIFPNLSPNSRITRKFKDRWLVLSDSVYPQIDDYKESLSQPELYRTSPSEIVGEDENHWYLIYKTDYENLSEQQLKTAPVSCYCVCEKELSTLTGSSDDVSIPADGFFGGTWYSLNEPGDKLELWTGTDKVTSATVSNSSMVFWTIESNAITLYTGNYGMASGAIRVVFTKNTGTKIKFTKAKNYYRQSSTLPSINIGVSTDVSDINTYVGINNMTSWNNPVFINAGSSAANVMDFKTWYEGNKANTTLIKVIELPYAPFECEMNGSSVVVPDGWEVVNNMFHLTTATEFKSTLSEKIPHRIPTAPTKADVNVNADRNDKWETKLYNSNYRMNKLVYDNASWSDKPETVTPLNLGTDMGITFHFSTSMDNSMLFEIDSKNRFQDTDYGDLITSNRSTEIPFYSNEYLNYLRYGKAVDEKNAQRAIAQSVLGGGGTIVSTAASSIFGFSQLKSIGGRFVGNVASAVTSVTSTALSIMATAQKAREEINAKIDAYTHQSSNVSSSNDLSIFKVYGKNKLMHVEYKPLPEVQSALGDYFYRFGYECDDRLATMSSSRYWFDYYAIEPEWKDNLIFEEFKDDIEARLRAGFVRFHYHNGYDLGFTKENWENALVDWSSK